LKFTFHLAASLNPQSPLIKSAVTSSPIGSGTNFSLVPPTKHCASSSEAVVCPSFAVLEKSFVVVVVSVVPLKMALQVTFTLMVSLAFVGVSFSFLVCWSNLGELCLSVLPRHSILSVPLFL